MGYQRTSGFRGQAYVGLHVKAVQRDRLVHIESLAKTRSDFASTDHHCMSLLFLATEYNDNGSVDGKQPPTH